MNSQINALKARYDSLEVDQAQISMELQIEYDKVFAAMPFIQDAVTKLESSTDYTWSDGDIASYLRIDLSDFRTCREYFDTYMRDTHCVDIDWNNDCLLYNQGPCIVINDGDVLDQESNEWFIGKDAYKDDDGHLDLPKRNALIEAYMERTGYYPGVFETDGHGNISFVNTKGV